MCIVWLSFCVQRTLQSCVYTCILRSSVYYQDSMVLNTRLYFVRSEVWRNLARSCAHFCETIGVHRTLWDQMYNLGLSFVQRTLKYYVDILGEIICTKKFEIRFKTVCMFVQSLIVISFDLWDDMCISLWGMCAESIAR